MKTRMLKWFDVFVTMMFAIPDLLAIGVARWRLEAAKNVASELAKQSVDFTDEMLLQVFGLIGMAVTIGGMKEEAAIEYAIKTARNGAGESPAILQMRELIESSALVAGMDKPYVLNITPDLTFDQYIAQLRSAGGLPDYEHAPDYIKKMHKRDFDHIKAHVYEQFEEFASESPASEQGNIAWLETEVEDVGKSDDYHVKKGDHAGVENLLNQAIKETLSDLFNDMRSSRRNIH